MNNNIKIFLLFSESDEDGSNVGSESENDYYSKKHDKEENNNEGIYDDEISDDDNEGTSSDNGEDNELEDDEGAVGKQGALASNFVLPSDDDEAVNEGMLFLI